MMQTVKLRSGVEMPMEGFGVFQVTDPAQCRQTVEMALDVGGLGKGHFRLLVAHLLDIRLGGDEQLLPGDEGRRCLPTPCSRRSLRSIAKVWPRSSSAMYDYLCNPVLASL